MDRKSLFDLPKEMLIEIILNVKKNNYNEKQELMRCADGARVDTCNEEGCEKFQVVNRYHKIIFCSDYADEQDMSQCDICHADYCDVHEKITYFICCGLYQCNIHHFCKTCATPLCLDCQQTREQCDKCTN